MSNWNLELQAYYKDNNSLEEGNYEWHGNLVLSCTGYNLDSGSDPMRMGIYFQEKDADDVDFWDGLKVSWNLDSSDPSSATFIGLDVHSDTGSDPFGE